MKSGRPMGGLSFAIKAQVSHTKAHKSKNANHEPSL